MKKQLLLMLAGGLLLPALSTVCEAAPTMYFAGHNASVYESPVSMETNVSRQISGGEYYPSGYYSSGKYAYIGGAGRIVRVDLTSADRGAEIVLDGVGSHSDYLSGFYGPDDIHVVGEDRFLISHSDQSVVIADFESRQIHEFSVQSDGGRIVKDIAVDEVHQLVFVVSEREDGSLSYSSMSFGGTVTELPSPSIPGGMSFVQLIGVDPARSEIVGLLQKTRCSQTPEDPYGAWHHQGGSDLDIESESCASLSVLYWNTSANRQTIVTAKFTDKNLGEISWGNHVAYSPSTGSTFIDITSSYNSVENGVLSSKKRLMRIDRTGKRKGRPYNVYTQNLGYSPDSWGLLKDQSLYWLDYQAETVKKLNQNGKVIDRGSSLITPEIFWSLSSGSHISPSGDFVELPSDNTASGGDLGQILIAGNLFDENTPIVQVTHYMGQSRIEAIAIGPEGNPVVAASYFGSGPGNAVFLNARTHGSSLPIPAFPLFTTQFGVTALRYDTRGGRYIAGSWNQAAGIWRVDPSSGASTKLFDAKAPGATVFSLELLNNNSQVSWVECQEGHPTRVQVGDLTALGQSVTLYAGSATGCLGKRVNQAYDATRKKLYVLDMYQSKLRTFDMANWPSMGQPSVVDVQDLPVEGRLAAHSKTGDLFFLDGWPNVNYYGVGIYKISSSGVVTYVGKDDRLEGTANIRDFFIVDREDTAPGDIDGDGVSDFSVFRRNPYMRYLIQTSSGAFFDVPYFGGSRGPDKVFLGEVDGDGRKDLISFNGAWSLRESSTARIATHVPYSLRDGDIPLIADFDGDGVDDRDVLYRPSDPDNGSGVAGETEIYSSWLIDKQGYAERTSFGLVGDIPVPADFDGDGKAEIAVWRPSNGTWYVLNVGFDAGVTGQQVTSKQWGLTGDIPVPADFDGDGKTDFVVWRPSTGTWFIVKSSDGSTVVQQWGLPGDVPVVGDYDGDGRLDYAVYRESPVPYWYVLTALQEVIVKQWGLPGDVPLR